MHFVFISALLLKTDDARYVVHKLVGVAIAVTCDEEEMEKIEEMQLSIVW